MEVIIKEKNENSLLKRVEVSGEMKFEGATPSNDVLAAALAKSLSVDISLVVVKNIYTTFSQQVANFSAVVYKDAKALAKFEVETKHMKKKAAEDDKKKAEEAAAKAEEEKKAAEEKAAAKEAEKAESEKPAKEKSEAPVEEEKKDEGAEDKKEQAPKAE